jgi:hypothetical protein
MHQHPIFGHKRSSPLRYNAGILPFGRAKDGFETPLRLFGGFAHFFFKSVVLVRLFIYMFSLQFKGTIREGCRRNSI